jgi:cytochrome c556
MKYWIAGPMIFVAAAAFAHSGVKDERVLARMAGMSAIAEHVKVIGSMAKGEMPFDAAAANAALTRIGDEAARVPALFEPEADDPKSEALPAIWDEFDSFEQKAVALETLAAERAGTVEASGDLAPLMRDIAGTCRDCHSEYRE